MTRLIACALGIALLPLSAAAAGFSVYPDAFTFDNKNDTQRLIAVTTREDGVTTDVTGEAAVTFEPAGILQWNAEARRLEPIADGETTIIVKHGEAEQRIATKVSNAGAIPAVSFMNEVQPVLMKEGCNSGACHGSASGKNGFMLTLFGFDPPLDYLHLTRQARSRRINIALPDESLFLEKAVGKVDHEGGTLFEVGSPSYNTLRRWIAEGANLDAAQAPKLTGIRILPEQAVLEDGGKNHQFVVVASYDNGTDRDVTDTAVLASSDELTVKFDETGHAVSAGRGEVYLMARYGTFAVVSQVIVVPTGLELEWPDVQPKNFVDEMVFAKLKKVRVPPAELCSDEVFVRRLFIDTLGVLPTTEETQAFLASEDPDKRAKLIDELIERPEFPELWTMKWAEALQVRTPRAGDKKGMHRYNDWLRQSFNSNKPIDQLVRELLSAEGGNFTAPAANFYLLENQPNLLAENVAQVFFGVQLQCAQCHNHPFERWTMEDYYSFAAFFAQVGRKGSGDPREQIVFNRGSGEVKNLKNGQVMAPKFLGGETPDVKGKDRRAVLADWMTTPENPWFAKNVANRVWDHFFGRGIISPPDDVRVTNPPSNPELLDELGRQLAAANYDLRSLVRTIANSHTYQMSTQPRIPGVVDEKNFALASVRRLPAEQLLDAISKVTETKVKFPALPLGARAVQAADGQTGNYFLNVFGRPARESACTCERSNDPTLAQALHLINGSTIDQAVKKPEARLTRMLKAETPTPDIIRDLYLASFSRQPTEEELAKLVAHVDGQEDRKAALEDVYWSVLNSKEFVFNH